MRTTQRFVVLAAALLAGTPALSQETPWLADARQVASSVPPRLLQVLTEEIAQGGPASAVLACSDKAPKMARAASEQSGWNIRRVSLKNRNPKAVPDAWERATLEDFDRRAAAGENPANLEAFTVVDNGTNKGARFMKALPVQQVCLSCHGPADKLDPDVVAQLRALYPDDKGVGYSLKQIRGAMTIRKPL